MEEAELELPESALPGAAVARLLFLEQGERAFRATPPELALGPGDITEASIRLEVDVATVKAVLEVESAGAGYLPDGRPKILPEGHIFWRDLAGLGLEPERLLSADPSLASVLYPKWTRVHYVGGSREYERLELMESIDRDAAWRSTSWGLFQIMGFNHRAAGHQNVAAYVTAMRRHERDQLAAFVALVTTWGLVGALRRRDWEALARRYNGPGQVARYATLLAAAWEKHNN